MAKTDHDTTTQRTPGADSGYGCSWRQAKPDAEEAQEQLADYDICIKPMVRSATGETGATGDSGMSLVLQHNLG
jgi:hypothetical protein